MSHVLSRLCASKSTLCFDPRFQQESKAPAPLLPHNVDRSWQIRTVLEGVGEWEWNVFDLVKVAKGHELKITGWCVKESCLACKWSCIFAFLLMTF